MAVKCLTDIQKNTIITWFKAKTYNQKELAEQFHTSERTINRVLNEAGLATAMPRIKGEAYQAMQVLQEYNLTPAGLKVLLSKYVSSAALQTAQAANHA